MPRACLEQFWHYYWLGDGTTMISPGRKPIKVISTSSKVMAGQFQEVLQKLGGWALIQVIDGSKYPSKLGKTTRLTYRLVRRAGATAYASSVQGVPYSGMVGNAETGIGPVYVRRCGRPVWAGLQLMRDFDNQAPLCRHHHRCKQAEGWWLEQLEPGVLVWRTPAGRTYTTTPTIYPH